VERGELRHQRRDHQKNAAYNGTLTGNGSTTFGFTANGNGSTAPSAVSCTSP
jgi:hypothetical protein